MAGPQGEIEELIALMARLPGLGPRSARRAVLQMLRKRAALMAPLAAQRTRYGDRAHACLGSHFAQGDAAARA